MKTNLQKTEHSLLNNSNCQSNTLLEMFKSRLNSRPLRMNSRPTLITKNQERMNSPRNSRQLLMLEPLLLWLTNRLSTMLKRLSMNKQSLS